MPPARRLAKARAFTSVCIVSLGIGMAPVIAVPYLARKPQVTRVGGGYLKTLGIPLLSGRDFSDADSVGSEKLTLISQALADRLFPSGGTGEAFGKRLTFSAAVGDTPPETLTIVGVTGDFPTSQMNTERAPLLLPLAQLSNSRPHSITTDQEVNRLPDLLLIARSAAGERPVKITAALENVVRELDREFPRDRIITGVCLRKTAWMIF